MLRDWDGWRPGLPVTLDATPDARSTRVGMFVTGMIGGGDGVSALPPLDPVARMPGAWLDNGSAGRIVPAPSGLTRRIVEGVMAGVGDRVLTDSGGAGGVGTWHYGLVARWWAETNVPEPGEVAYYADAIRRHGEPALDVGCGTGRLLLPLLAEGLDVDGTDISADMISHAAAAAREHGYAPRLAAVPTHALALDRRYGTILMCGVFGIGATPDQDREALRRIHRHLRPGGALLIAHWLPYADRDEKGWARWLPGHRGDVPRDWPAEGDRRRLRDGDELELITRLARLEPLAQRQTLEIRARLWHDGALVREESASLDENLYFAQELRSMLIEAGFADVVIEGPHTSRPATDDDDAIIFVART